MNSLNGITALITGVSRRKGIGFAIAKRLANRGANLFLHAYAPYDKTVFSNPDLSDPQILQKELAEYEISVAGIEADFSDLDAPGVVMQAATEKFGHIDILILNHTYDTTKTLDELTADEIDHHLAVNVRAALLLIQEFERRHDGRPGGRVILLTSGQHLGPMPHLAYVASKGALHQLTVSLSDRLIDKGITVNTVNPGPTKSYTPDSAIDKAVLQRMPLGRWGEPDDAARLIAWLVSEDAQWITGQIINSEGGFRRG